MINVVVCLRFREIHALNDEVRDRGEVLDISVQIRASEGSQILEILYMDA